MTASEVWRDKFGEREGPYHFQDATLFFKINPCSLHHYCPSKISLKELPWGCKDTQELRALVALAEDWVSVPSVHMVISNYIELQFWGIKCPLLASASTACTCPQEKTPTHNE